MINWLKESNRDKHLLLAIPAGFLFTILFVAGLASGMEFKDEAKYSDKYPINEWKWEHWDWLDWFATMLGGLIGQILQIILLIIIL